MRSVFRNFKININKKKYFTIHQKRVFLFVYASIDYSLLNEPAALDNKTHLMERDGASDDSKPCSVCTQVWLPTESDERFESKPFLYIFCYATRKASATQRNDLCREICLKRTFQRDGIEKQTLRNNMRFPGMVEEFAEEVYQKMFDIA